MAWFQKGRSAKRFAARALADRMAGCSRATWVTSRIAVFRTDRTILSLEAVGSGSVSDLNMPGGV
jgi:hypothetical protein